MPDKPIIHIDFAISRDCQNLEASYGEICVKCNKCGRFADKQKGDGGDAV